MKLSSLQLLHQAPASGWLLLYLRKKVVFQPYSSIDEIKDICGDEDILEIHLFDRKKEYRAIVSESARLICQSGINQDSCHAAGSDAIEHVADFPDDAHVYQERTLLESGYGPESMTVLNHISFNELGMSSIDDYRLLVEE